LFRKLLYFFGLVKVNAKCGHQTKVMERIEMVDERGKMVIGRIENVMNPEFCIDCLRKKLTVSDIGDTQQVRPIK